MRIEWRRPKYFDGDGNPFEHDWVAELYVEGVYVGHVENPGGHRWCTFTTMGVYVDRGFATEDEARLALVCWAAAQGML